MNREVSYYVERTLATTRPKRPSVSLLQGPKDPCLLQAGPASASSPTCILRTTLLLYNVHMTYVCTCLQTLAPRKNWPLDSVSIDANPPGQPYSNKAMSPQVACPLTATKEYRYGRRSAPLELGAVHAHGTTAASLRDKFGNSRWQPFQKKRGGQPRVITTTSGAHESRWLHAILPATIASPTPTRGVDAGDAGSRQSPSVSRLLMDASAVLCMYTCTLPYVHRLCSV